MTPFWPSSELDNDSIVSGIHSDLPCWCNRGSWGVCFRTSRFGLLRCQHCGCYRIDPPPLMTDDELPGFYTNYYADRGQVEDRVLSDRFWRVAAQIPDLGTPGERVADIGCGDGHLCAQLKARGWKHVVGIDVSRTRIEGARRLYPEVTFYHEALRQTDLTPGTFDLMIMDNVIEHLASPQKSVAEVCRYLKPGGQLLIITPNMESGSFRLLSRYWTSELAPSAHVFLFTRDSLAHLLKRIGVQEVKTGTFQPAPSPRDWLATVKKGDFKSLLWRMGQRLGALFGLIIGSGDMTFVLCARPNTPSGFGRNRSSFGPVMASPSLFTRGLTVVVPTYKRPASLARLLDSLLIQDRPPDEILVVDASPLPDTEQQIQTLPSAIAMRDKLKYWRVSGPLVGLTRQKNFALRHVRTDLVAFFDDDIVLERECLREMERVLRREPEDIVGVGCFTASESAPSALWRLRRTLGIVPSLKAGTYARSGISVPWQFQPSPEPIVEGDWLPGGAQLVRTAAAIDIGFEESFGGYAQAEDLAFSLRLRAKGKLVMARAARLQHLHEPAGRPNPFRVGYMELYNRYQIHRRATPVHRWKDVAWFTYAWTVDTMLLTRHLRSPREWAPMAQQIAGRVAAAGNILKDQTLRRHLR